jgi:hypothetical protein
VVGTASVFSAYDSAIQEEESRIAARRVESRDLKTRKRAWITEHAKVNNELGKEIETYSTASAPAAAKRREATDLTTTANELVAEAAELRRRADEMEADAASKRNKAATKTREAMDMEQQHRHRREAAKEEKRVAAETLAQKVAEADSRLAKIDQEDVKIHDFLTRLEKAKRSKAFEISCEIEKKKAEEQAEIERIKAKKQAEISDLEAAERDKAKAEVDKLRNATGVDNARRHDDDDDDDDGDDNDGYNDGDDDGSGGGGVRPSKRHCADASGSSGSAGSAYQLQPFSLVSRASDNAME